MILEENDTFSGTPSILRSNMDRKKLIKEEGGKYIICPSLKCLNSYDALLPITHHFKNYSPMSFMNFHFRNT